MIPLLNKILFGATDIREYVTVNRIGNIAERVYLETREATVDVSRHQWLLCLEPRIFGVWVGWNAGIIRLDQKTGYKLYFSNGGVMDKNKAVAVVTLELLDKIEDDKGILLLLKVKESLIRHLPAIQARLLYSRVYRKPGFSFGQLKDFASAYSYPRRVRIISFTSDEGLHYFFPMDLLGETGGKYLFGLRHTNLALKGIMEAKKIVVSEVPATYRDLIYELGKGHITVPPPIDERSFQVLPTRQFGFYVPDWAESYKEIRIGQTRDLGSHMLLIGEWEEEVMLRPVTPRLHHIHFLYTLYQRRKGMADPIF